MIHHLSVAADDPQRVAGVFAELLEGFVVPFAPNPGSFLAVARDGNGTGVEVLPADTVLEPNGPTGVRFSRTTRSTPHSPVHFALSVGVDAATIFAIAAREGWECVECDRDGNFDVIELWVENRWLVELLPPSFAARYLSFCQAVTDGLGADAWTKPHGSAAHA
jgi:hypothetical protein